MSDIKRLYHSYGETEDSFFRRVDEFGGWPLGKKYVSFLHAIGDENRVCEFGDQELRNENWTTIACADDYYEWKLSPERKAKMERCAAKQVLMSALARL